GMPQCVNSETQYEKAFGAEAVARCRGILNGAPCKPKNHGVGTGDYAHDYGCYQCTLDALATKGCSSDAFAIRPNAFKVFSQNLYKRSGEDFNITIKAIDEGNGTISGVNKDNVFGVSGYNASFSDLSVISVPLNEKITNITGPTPLPNTNGCLNAGVFTKNGSNFVDGNTTATLSFSETGILDINVSESPGHEWAIVDADDTPDNDRYIKSSIQSYDESNVSAHVIYAFIPYTIETTAALDATTAQRWLYVNESYFNDGRPNVKPMGGIITYAITAKNKNGDVTKNFDKECFSYVDEALCPKINGLKKNTTFDLFLDANITTNADRNRKIIFYTEDNASNAVYVPTKTYNYLQNTPMKIQEWVGSDVFKNGIGYAKVYFNFDRNQTVAINPLNVSIVDINTSTSWMANAGATNNFVGMTPMDHNLTFVYGRFIPRDVRVFGEIPFSANGWYEVYGAPTIGNTALISSRNDSGWYINSLHDNMSGGNATVDYISSGALPTSTTHTNGLETYGFAGRIPIYSAKAHINTEPWLWYGMNALDYADPSSTNLDCQTHPCFNINIVPNIGTAGSATNTEMRDEKANKGTSRGTGVQYDYTPAIR
ncbi:MAG: hypothetical protein IE884_06555, partial [Sulfuricurvum sp.]|nr:hypothetical protein [Sulfuricurvum sp.]